MGQKPVLIILLAASTLFFADAVADDNLLTNGDFKDWRDGVPLGWSIITGASKGEGPASEVKPLGAGVFSEQGGLSLAAFSDTRNWHAVTQSFAVVEGETYELVYEARALDVRREGDQWDNCYVGMFFKDQAGEPLGHQLGVVTAADWAEDSVVAEAPRGAVRCEVLVFLSKTGTLQVKWVAARLFRPAGSFAALVKDMDRHYSQFALRGVDWKSLTFRYLARAEATGTPREFASVIKSMLSELRDPHVWVQAPGGAIEPTFSGG